MEKFQTELDAYSDFQLCEHSAQNFRNLVTTDEKKGLLNATTESRPNAAMFAGMLLKPQDGNDETPSTSEGGEEEEEEDTASETPPPPPPTTKEAPKDVLDKLSEAIPPRKDPPSPSVQTYLDEDLSSSVDDINWGESNSGGEEEEEEEDPYMRVGQNVDGGYQIALSSISRNIKFYASECLTLSKSAREADDVSFCDPRITESPELVSTIKEEFRGLPSSSKKTYKVEMKSTDWEVLSRCLHFVPPKDDARGVYPSVDECPKGKTPPMVNICIESWILFVCGVVHEACKQSRQRASLKDNPKTLSSIDHPIFSLCKEGSDPFEDFFNGVSQSIGGEEGVVKSLRKGMWDELYSRVSSTVDEVIVSRGEPPKPIHNVPTSPVAPVIKALTEAVSIEWCHGNVPSPNFDKEATKQGVFGFYYCAMTGSRLNDSQECYACNIKVAEGEKIRDNAFLIGKEIDNPPLNWRGDDDGRRFVGKVQPFDFFQMLVALKQCDLAIKQNISDWLDSEELRRISKNGVEGATHNPLFVADALTSMDGIARIAEWYTYIVFLCYVVDTLLPRRVF
jgi:hypothetical protein